MRQKSSKKIKSTDFSLEHLQQDLLKEAKSVKIQSGFANLIANQVTQTVSAFLSTHPVVTKSELDTLITTELNKYNKDLAYIYHNRDKII